jgi:hypothetical protein
VTGAVGAGQPDEHPRTAGAFRIRAQRESSHVAADDLRDNEVRLLLCEGRIQLRTFVEPPQHGDLADLAGGPGAKSLCSAFKVADLGRE